MSRAYLFTKFREFSKRFLKQSRRNSIQASPKRGGPIALGSASLPWTAGRSRLPALPTHLENHLGHPMRSECLLLRKAERHDHPDEAEKTEDTRNPAPSPGIPQRCQEETPDESDRERDHDQSSHERDPEADRSARGIRHLGGFCDSSVHVGHRSGRYYAPEERKD